MFRKTFILPFVAVMLVLVLGSHVLTADVQLTLKKLKLTVMNGLNKVG
ncbi:hypothetical protein [Thermicanus aegyptius]|nr:hypothetical protein [Thermicanus aegyptius]